jgi:hypothetical protein
VVVSIAAVKKSLQASYLGVSPTRVKARASRYVSSHMHAFTAHRLSLKNCFLCGFRENCSATD